jgi:GNAT superfamily N-acetyltransferase
MDSRIVLRALTDQDGPALAGLSFSSSDEGSIRYTANYRMDAVQAIKAIHRDMAGVVALEGDTRLIGIGLVRFGECLYEGEIHPFALLGNLIVHPDYRKQGLATRLAQWRIDLAIDRFGKDTIILANFQHGNVASNRTVRKWARQVCGPYLYFPLTTRPDRPKQLAGFAFQALENRDLPAYTEGLNFFYQDYNLYQPVSAHSLEQIIRESPFSTPIRHLFTALDSTGEPVAGLSVFEEYRLKIMEIRGIPLSIRVINKIIKMVPPDGAVRQIYMDRIWFRPGFARAARCLVEHMRWHWHDRVSNLSVFFDPRSSLHEIFNPQPWKMTTRSSLAICAPQEIDPHRLVCPIY